MNGSESISCRARALSFPGRFRGFVGRRRRCLRYRRNVVEYKIATAYIAERSAAWRFSQPIVSRVGPLEAFHPAEDRHQDYARLKPNQPCIVINDAPKVAAMQKLLPELQPVH